MHRKQRGALIALGLAMLLALALMATACATRNREADQTTAQARAYDPRDAFLGQEIVDDAASVLERMFASGDYSGLEETLPHARGVLIVPNYCRVSWLYGVGAGMGLFLGRAEDGSWSAPSFAQLAHGGFGLQIGVERATLVYVFLDEMLLEEALVSGFDFTAGADLTLVQNLGHTETGNRLHARPLYLFVQADGLWAGVALSGGVVDSRDDINGAYYGAVGITPEAIVLGRAVAAPDAGELQQLLTVDLSQEDVPILR